MACEACARGEACGGKRGNGPSARRSPDSTAHRAEQLRLALLCVADDAPDRAERALKVLEWNPLVDAEQEFDETIADLLGPCNEVLLDFEGRQISPEWLDLPAA